MTKTIIAEFRSRFQKAIQNLAAINPPNESPDNSESIEGVYIRNILNFSTYAIDAIDSQASWLNVKDLTGLLIAVTRAEDNLMSARHIRRLLGRDDNTLKEAINAAQYYLRVGEQYETIVDKQEEELLKKREAEAAAIEAKRQAGYNSHGLDSDLRLKRNKKIQSFIDKLCLSGNYLYLDACKEAAKEFSLSTDHIRKNIAKNPLD